MATNNNEKEPLTDDQKRQVLTELPLLQQEQTKNIMTTTNGQARNGNTAPCAPKGVTTSVSSSVETPAPLTLAPFIPPNIQEDAPVTASSSQTTSAIVSISQTTTTIVPTIASLSNTFTPQGDNMALRTPVVALNNNLPTQTGLATNQPVLTCIPILLGGNQYLIQVLISPDMIQPQVPVSVLASQIQNLQPISSNNIPIAPQQQGGRRRPIKVEELPDSQGIKRSRTDDEQSSGTSSNRPTTAQAPAISLPPPPTPHDAIILFDLQTTGLARDSDICQISAQVYGEETMWSEYLIPTNDFSPQSSCLNGFHMTVNENEENILCKNGIPVEAKSYTEGLKAFYDYLCHLSRKQKRFDPNARLVLVAHNCRSFDKRILLNAFEKINMTRDKLNALGICFADSLKILHELQQGGHLLLNYTEEEDMENGGKKLSLALANIYNRLFGEYFVDFDASEHVKAMKRVLFDPQIGVTEDFIKDRTFM